MLEELRIHNFAIIEELELRFDVGFNVITGETGAGKSIIIDAVELLLGSKASTSFVRSGAERAIIEGVFRLDAALQMRLLPLLEAQELMGDEPDLITLTREIRSSGRSSARVNGITVRANVLGEIGNALVDIHGQSTHLSLFKPRYHIDLLDHFAGILEVREALATVVKKLSDIRDEARALQDDKDALERRADRLRYEVDEIEKAGLSADEEADLIAERNRLANSEQLATLAAKAVTLLSGDEPGEAVGAVDLLMQLANVVGRVARIDPDLADEHSLTEEMSANAQELAITLAGYMEEVEFDPARLDELEERLEVIKMLKRRYRADSIAGVLAYAEKAANELENLENSDERLHVLRQQEEKTLRHIGELSQRLSRTREASGRSLAVRVINELKDLRMANTQFEVVMHHTEDAEGCYIEDKRYAFDATGIDKVEFMMSANPGEPLRALAHVASGGEAARIMLALKRVLTQADETPILIFDEIDQGIGGRIGAVVGEKLWSLSMGHQVMVVTHLPQLAGFSDAHYHVLKQIKRKRTATAVHVLGDDDARISELAAMLGAQGASGLQSAKELLDAARQRKTEITQAGQPQQQNLL